MKKNGVFDRMSKWLLPGMKIKRWIFLSWIGLTLFSLGFILFMDIKIPLTMEQYIVDLIHSILKHRIPSEYVDLFLIFLGLFLLLIGIRQWFVSIYEAVEPYQKKSLVDLVYEKRQLEHGLKIVAIGGGTGLSSLLRGLKKYTSNITAVVTVADDGGSSGRLRKDMGVIPPGDIRNCLSALSDEENLMTELFQYRFSEGDLGGHSFGNLFLVAMSQVSGDFQTAIKQSGKVLAIKGRVLPASLCPVNLCGEMEDKTIVEGESVITKDYRKINRIFLDPIDCKPPEEVKHAISEANLVILGPGSLYTSVIPNLLVEGMVEAINSSPAIVAYVCNVMTQPGETDDYTASDHIKAIKKHTPDLKIDYCLVNDRIPSWDQLEKYKSEGAESVKADQEEIRKSGTQPVVADLISSEILVRHDSDKLAQQIIKLIEHPPHQDKSNK